MTKKILMPKTGPISNWQEFVCAVRKSIKRNLGNGIITLNKNYANKKYTNANNVH
jgi:hypothetical protein